MNKKENIPFELAETFVNIDEEKKKRIIRMCAMIIGQHKDKSDSKLRENKEAAKKFIFESEMNKEGNFIKANKELELAEFIGSYIISNKDVYINLPTSARERKLLEEMVQIGIIKNEKTIKRIERDTQYEKIDLSQLNNPDLLLTNRQNGKKEIKYGRYSKERRVPHAFDYNGRKVQITRIGRLYYKTSFMLEADIDEYLLQKGNTAVELFTYGLDMERLGKDERYRKVFFEELINDANLNMDNNNGYIGSIITTKDEDKYKIDYSEEEYTAVTELKERLDKVRIGRIANDGYDR